MTDDLTNEELTTAKLEAVLVSIGHHLEIPADVARPATDRSVPFRRGFSRPLLVAAAVAAIVAGAAAAVPATRAAIADVLGIGSTRIEITGEPFDGSDLPHLAEGLRPVSVEDAITIVGRDLPDTSRTALGPPVALYRMPAAEGGVLLAWREDTATLWVRPTREGDIIFRKLLASAEGVEPVDDLGTEALVLTEAHVLETPLRRLSAENVVIWYDDANEYRLEADLSPAALIDLARSFE